jgi:hypothetical protein
MSAPDTPITELRKQLGEIGRRRAQIRAQTTQLSFDTAVAIRKAQGVLSLTEIATLIGVDRTGLYRTYGA